MSTTATAAPPVAQTLARFICDTRPADIPAAVHHEAKRAILNSIGATLGGRRDPSIAMLLELIGPFAGKPEATVIGQRERLDLLNAAFMNAITGSVLEFDDTHEPTVIHPSAVVLPPLLALADRAGCTGVEFLTAFALGADVACRLGNAVSPGHYVRGWHITASCGIFGAAAASARLLGLDAARTAHALGIPASLASGNVENLPSGAKNIGIGHAARNGLFAALLAERGVTAAPRAIEGPTGFARACGDEASHAELTGDLGQRWELQRNAYKPYPCGVVLNAVVDACLALRRQGATAAEIATVRVTGNALLLARADRPDVTDGKIGKVSLQHAAAIAFLYGEVGVQHFEEPFTSSREVDAMRRRVAASRDDAAPAMTATVEVTTKEGRTLSQTVLKPSGSVENPLSDADIAGKVRGLSDYGRAGCPIDRVIETVTSLENIADVRDLSRLLGIE